MIRYRCPHCALLTAAHERRVGQASVCKACLKPHQIPTDAALWLTETGDPLHPTAEPPPAPVTEEIREPELTAARPEDAPPAQPDPVPVFQPVQSAEPALVEPPPAVGPSPEAQTEPVPVIRVIAPVPLEPEPSEPVFATGRLREAERPLPVAAVAEHEREAGAVATVVTPQPQPARKPLPAAAPLARPGRFATAAPQPGTDTPAPRYAEPVQLQTQADIAAALTTALTARMKPRAAPRRDLRPSTALWMLLTGLGVAFFLVSLFANPDNRWVALTIGAVQIALGYAWIVRLTHLRDPRRGLLCAIPFVAPYYLAQHKYARLRPLRFVATGGALVALALAAPALANLTRPLVPKGSEPKPAPVDIATQPKLVQLRAYRDRREYDNLVKLLGVLVKTDPIRSADARDRTELATDLEGLCQHEDRAVRLAAMSAFVSWDEAPNAAKARQVCLDAIRSPSEDERVRALFLLPRWKDSESARAAQSLIARPNRQTNQALKSLEEIGGAPAEQAALALLKRATDQTIRLIAIDILVKVGGPAAADELERYALTADDIGARNGAAQAAEQIRNRLRPAPAVAP